MVLFLVLLDQQFFERDTQKIQSATRFSLFFNVENNNGVYLSKLNSFGVFATA